MLVIIDYGMGNIGSIVNIIKKNGFDKPIVTSNARIIKKASKIILPGVGSFDHGMNNLESYGLVDVLGKLVVEYGVPILGICLGMQLMTKSSDEGQRSGLGWINAKTNKIDNKGLTLRVPHMGWNNVIYKKNSILFDDMYDDPRFYFVHSFYVDCLVEDDILTITEYGNTFVSSFQSNNVYGVQFHPEKSHKFGMKLFHNFITQA